MHRKHILRYAGLAVTGAFLISNYGGVSGIEAHLKNVEQGAKNDIAKVQGKVGETGKGTGAQANAGNLSLITLPASGVAPVTKLITSAKHSVQVVMYEFEDPTVEQALAADAKRGVRVQVLLNGGYYGAGFPQNAAAMKFFKANGVPVRATSKHFALTHQKSVEVDGRKLMVMTFNLTPQYYAGTRDFAVTDTDHADVTAAMKTFASDWTGVKSAGLPGHDLVWSPGSTTELVNVITHAHGTLDIYNEEMANTTIVDALIAAQKRGVDVKVVMTADSGWVANFKKLTAAGVHVHLFKNSTKALYIHAKMELTGNTADLGSENYSVTSLERNRELGIVFTRAKLARSLRKTFNTDYANAAPFSG